MDVAAEAPLTFAELAERLDFPGVEEVRFGFNPDWMKAEVDWVEQKDDPLFVRGDWELGGPFCLPWMIRT